MLQFSNEMPITLEALDANGGVLSGTAAILRHLDGVHAVVGLSSQTSALALQWGTPVRFQVADGLQNYSVFGMVIAHDLPSTRETPGDPERPETLECEATLHLWECRPSEQQRVSPRRPTHFDVHFRALDAENPAAQTPQDAAWQTGVCVDLGGGGLRLQVPQQIPLSKRMELRFTLPATEGEKTGDRKFTLRGRVLRNSPHRSGLEIAVRFERLPVAEGIALSTYLA